MVFAVEHFVDVIFFLLFFKCLPRSLISKGHNQNEKIVIEHPKFSSISDRGGGGRAQDIGQNLGLGIGRTLSTILEIFHIKHDLKKIMNSSLPPPPMKLLLFDKKKNGNSFAKEKPTIFVGKKTWVKASGFLNPFFIPHFFYPSLLYL